MPSSVQQLTHRASPSFPREQAGRELQRRMLGPQRHRLLHGYPLTAAMSPRTPADPGQEVDLHPGAGRGLLVGVLPHPFCNPTIAGCGFCTFPHQTFHSDLARTVVEHVIDEVRQRLDSQPLSRRQVAALYLGGATANLTPPDSFRRLCRELARVFDLRAAEVTLEGVPVYFVKRQPLLLDIMREELPARHHRISMGIQSFSDSRLRSMGRLAFGTAATFREVVDLAHGRGFTVSADLLFDLPHQRLDEMREDVLQALDIGLDHLGLYHLVLFSGLGTAWSRDTGMLAGVPANDQAAEHWLALRDLLLARRFHQTTLTNFERIDLRGDPRHFLYEELSFEPDAYQVAGFGPTAISFAADPGFRSASKTLNPESASDYTKAVAAGKGAWSRHFTYGSRDLRILYLTRRLAALRIDRPAYARLFGTDAATDFSDELDALEGEGLVQVTPTEIRPTPRGMFYADSIAGLLAWKQFKARRGGHPVRTESVAIAAEYGGPILSRRGSRILRILSYTPLAALYGYVAVDQVRLTYSVLGMAARCLLVGLGSLGLLLGLAVLGLVRASADPGRYNDNAPMHM